MVFRFCELFSGLAMPSRRYNILLNHIEIRNCLTYIEKHAPAKKVHRELKGRVRQLLRELLKKQ
jgi:hypothetical protein